MYSAFAFSARPYSAARRGMFIDRRTTYPGESQFAFIEGQTERIVQVGAIVDQLRPVAVCQIITVPS